MNDLGVAPKNQPQADSRANLFYLLQTLSREKPAAEREGLSESHIMHQQTETHNSQSGPEL
jgi:hypothetical protein